MSNEDMRLRFLGTGTSTGVPVAGCRCRVCRSTDPRDKRLRTSAILSVQGKNLLIDCGPDFRSQILACGSPSLAALLITHSHYDHVGGIDDLRPYCHRFQGGFPVYCKKDVATDLRNRVPYCFAEHLYPGVPTFKIQEIRPYEPFEACGIKVMPLKAMHYNLEILGFRIGNLAYITDAKIIPEETIDMIAGVDTLVINALRIKEHLSHMNLRQALEVIGRVKPRMAYLIHLCHHMGLHREVSRELPENVRIAFDSETILIPSQP